jgi:prepilin peptidase CpaA
MADWLDSSLPIAGFRTATAGYLVLVVLATLTAITDLAQRTIPNILTYSASAIGLALGATAGWSGVVSALVGFVGLGIPMLLLFQYGALGGGDVKLVAAFGALLGLEAGAAVFLFGTLISGVLLLVYWAPFAVMALGRVLLAAGRTLGSKWGSLDVASGIASLRLFVPDAIARGLKESRRRRMPLAPGLAVAAILFSACKLGLPAGACFSVLHLGP